MAFQSGTEYAKVIQEFHAHVAKVGLSWTDDAVTLICTREECMEQIHPSGYEPRDIWWQREIPYMCTPEVAADLRNKHVRGEW